MCVYKYLSLNEKATDNDFIYIRDYVQIWSFNYM